MFDWLYKLLGSMLSFFNSITGSYALALLFYALVFKLLFSFFSVKQQKNQVAMAKLTPKIEIIKKKYKGRTDSASMQKQQMEIMELQKKEGFSPFSGCLPLIVQLVLIMFLYAVIQNPLSYIAKENDTLKDYNDNISNEDYEIPEDIKNKYSSLTEERKKINMDDIILAIYNDIDEKSEGKAESVPGNYEISLVSTIYNFVKGDSEIYKTEEDRIAHIESFGLSYKSIPNFQLFGVNLAETPSFKNFSILVLIPILAAISSWLSMVITRKLGSSASQPQDPQTRASMKIMDLVMPLMTLFISFNFSGMLGIYWIYQSLLGILQSFVLAKIIPVPKYTEEELKEIEKMKKEAEKEAKNIAKSQAKHKSLHYIDEDDYDELPEVKTNGQDKDKKQPPKSSDIPEIKD